MARASARATDPLADYHRKRDFERTTEPKGVPSAGDGHIFMVQKHEATRLHFDFRLELDGVLKSWAVTKGPSADPDDKRLAVRTEDHPMAYATFEGTIPDKEYGGGTVMLWDRGTWSSIAGKDPRQTLAEGHLHFILHGERMKGEWLLVRMKPRSGEKRENWLLRKVADAYAGASGDLVDRAVTSVASGRTMAEIAHSGDDRKIWHSDAAAAKRDPQAESEPAPHPPRSPTRNPGGRGRAGLPDFRPPQLATLADAVPDGPGWFHEVKYDGYRCLMAVSGGEARAYTRTGQDWSDRFASIVAAFAQLDLPAALIDGEIVALDRDGQPSFQALQAALNGASTPLTYFAFDLISQSGEDLTKFGNAARKERLAALLAGASDPIHLAEHVSQGEMLLETLCRAGYEGIVSKRADAPYRGRRTQSWLKVKCTRRQEFVIIGWLPSERGRGFRSLLLGVNDAGQLRYAGKVGTGFSLELIDSLLARMASLARESPAVEVPAIAARGAHWITPKLVAEIAFAEETEDGLLRHASFIGLREDKSADAVISEKPVKIPAADHFGVRISNPDRVIYPESKRTKGDLADYYAAMADPILRWSARRPLSLVRCPQGIGDHCFFQKHDAGSFGDAVRHVSIVEKDGDRADYLYVEDGAGLLSCVQMGAIEFHGWGSRIDPLERPDRMVFDLDPDAGLGFDAVKNGAILLHDQLAEIGLVSDPMLSGGKGLHIIVPLDQTAEWPAVKDFANRFARAMAEARPKDFTANMKKTERTGRIFIDWLRNQRGATAIMPYCVRARPHAPVATPVTWEELADIDSPARFTIADLEDLRARASGRALRRWGDAKQTLPDI